MACTLFTFCRRSFWGHHSITKCCSVYSTNARQKKTVPKEIIHVPYEDAKEVVLSFFNKCDEVTMRKLITLKPSQFENYDFGVLHKSIFQLSDRFASIDDFMKSFSLTPKIVENMAQTILELQEREKGTFGMKAIQPIFSKKGKENIDKVVVLDVFRKNVSWCVRSTTDHAIQDLGTETLNIPNNYDHTKYHPQIEKFVQSLPESDVYLLNSMSKRTKGRQVNYFTLQQAVIEAVFVTLLNEKHSKIDRTDTIQDISINDDVAVKNTAQDKKMKWSNRVYLWDLLAMKDFYEVVFKGDQLPTTDIIKNLYKERRDVMNYWKMDTDQIRGMFYKNGCEQLSLCVLMSDAFCRCLKKTDDAFPSAYS